VTVREVAIREIRVDEVGRLLVVPDLSPQEDFAHIYRAAMEVSWSASARGLLSPALRPGGWTYSEWFRHILRAAADEYGTTLVIDAGTRWSMDAKVRRQIESSL
jgi:Integron Cassette Protein Hfx_Cass5